MRNGGVGTRVRRFRDNDGNVYIFEDRAYHCPDASHPIMAVGDWQRKGATVMFHSGNHFKNTDAGKMLPKGKQTFIIDKQGRIINAQPIDDMPNLSWLVPIQPTTVADIEGPVLIHNRKIAASVLDKCFETHPQVPLLTYVGLT